ncbi:MAG TPA: response regulator [Labilithrix sp.]|nr:response regulator [Labilithrix sp.]
MRSVLLVDDDADIREAAAFVLEDAGYHVVSAANGKEALSALERGLRPSVIVLDLMMPVMNGWEFHDNVRHNADLASIPMVVVTGDPMATQRADKLEVAAYLRKPFDASALLDLVGRIASPNPT